MQILERGSSGVLALMGDSGYPYAVPLNYVYDNSKLYFHSSKSGHKIDAVRKYDKASFCVVDRDDIAPEEYTTYFRSVIAFGNIRILDDDNEIRTALEKLAVKYYPNDEPSNRDRIICGSMGRMCIMELTVEHVTGKSAVEIVSEDTNHE